MQQAQFPSTARLAAEKQWPTNDHRTKHCGGHLKIAAKVAERRFALTVE
jgi:hypothetical protein